jgi:hypothetical protein
VHSECEIIAKKADTLGVMRNPHITAEKLRQITAYNAESGELIWKVMLNPRGPVGATVGNLMATGYRQTQMFGNKYYIHRLVWLYVTGSWPTSEIDHIDGNKSNNRFGNLREATVSENQQNRKKPQANSALGLLGVSRNGKHSFRATIKFDGKFHHIGNFPTPEAAHAAYLAKKRQVHPFGTL